jgi:hypothetical protein
MPVIVVGAEKNLAGLKPRLFEGSVSAAATREVNEAIKAANPHVDVDKLEPGTILTVPDDLPKVAIRGGISFDAPSKETVVGLAEQSRTALKDLVSVGKEAAKAATAERKQAAKALDDDALAAAARKDKSLAADLKAVRAALEEAETGAKARTDALGKAQAEWTAQLKALEKLLPEPGK